MGWSQIPQPPAVDPLELPALVVLVALVPSVVSVLPCVPLDPSAVMPVVTPVVGASLVDPGVVFVVVPGVVFVVVPDVVLVVVLVLVSVVCSPLSPHARAPVRRSSGRDPRR